MPLAGASLSSQGRVVAACALLFLSFLSPPIGHKPCLLHIHQTPQISPAGRSTLWAGTGVLVRDAIEGMLRADCTGLGFVMRVAVVRPQGLLFNGEATASRMLLHSPNNPPPQEK